MHVEEYMLHGYFVSGAPVLVTQNITPTRQLVNGTPALLYSLNLEDREDERIMAIAMTNGYDEEWTNLSKAPASVNVVVGGTKENPRHWHGIELGNHSYLISVQSTPQDALSESGSEQIVPLIMLPHGEEARLYSVFTAENIGKDRIKVKQHPYMLAFALTDFKLQGRTLNKLVISIPRGAVGKGQLQSFYVLVSRVRKLADLRLLQRDDIALNNLIQKAKHPAELVVFEKAHNERGDWQPNLVREAWAIARTSQQTQNKSKQGAQPASKKQQPAGTPQRPRRNVSLTNEFDNCISGSGARRDKQD